MANIEDVYKKLLQITNDIELIKINQFSITSSLNSTETVLLNGETYVGTPEINGYSDLMVVPKADQNGVLYVEFSVDGAGGEVEGRMSAILERVL